MATIEHIDFKETRPNENKENQPWEETRTEIKQLPQIFWANGTSWMEANLWALEKIKIERKNIKTATSCMKHLRAYANYLEETEQDWMLFPTRASDRVLHKYRGQLIKSIDKGILTSSTARARMSAIINFYRYAMRKDLTDSNESPWKERMAKISYVDTTGFKRTLSRATTDLSIPNRTRPGIVLEEGLTPLTQEHMNELLDFVKRRKTTELYLMLMIGFFTGARIGTITTLRKESLTNARGDPHSDGLHYVRVGPGTGVDTKFDIEGELIFPDFLLTSLKQYATSERRLLREAKSKESNKSYLFITKKGEKYSVNSVNRLIHEMRKEASENGHKFATHFRFHQSRATYGTWTLQTLLKTTTTSVAIEFVRRALFHKDESTTLKYVKFIENNKGKQDISKAFSDAFLGASSRDWNSLNE